MPHLIEGVRDVEKYGQATALLLQNCCNSAEDLVRLFNGGVLRAKTEPLRRNNMVGG